jgi:hypothetical protein
LREEYMAKTLVDAFRPDDRVLVVCGLNHTLRSSRC